MMVRPKELLERSKEFITGCPTGDVADVLDLIAAKSLWIEHLCDHATPEDKPLNAGDVVPEPAESVLRTMFQKDGSAKDMVDNACSGMADAFGRSVRAVKFFVLQPDARCLELELFNIDRFACWAAHAMRQHFENLHSQFQCILLAEPAYPPELEWDAEASELSREISKLADIPLTFTLETTTVRDLVVVCAHYIKAFILLAVCPASCYRRFFQRFADCCECLALFSALHFAHQRRESQQP